MLPDAAHFNQIKAFIGNSIPYLDVLKRQATMKRHSEARVYSPGIIACAGCQQWCKPTEFNSLWKVCGTLVYHYSLVTG